MIAAAELAVQIELSRAFIAADAISVTLLRPSRTSDGAGGTATGARVPVSPQTFRILPQEDGATARVTSEGETATPEFMLMGLPDCDMARFDEFVLPAGRFQIVYIDNRQYEIKGEAVYLGG